MSGPTLRGIFNRVDVNRDGSLDRAEVKKFVEDADVGSGLFGGKKVNGATDAFVDAFDGNKDGRVGWEESEIKANANTELFTADASDKQSGATYGVGGRWNFSNNMGFFVEWMKNDKIEVDSYLAGIDFRF